MSIKFNPNLLPMRAHKVLEAYLALSNDLTGRDGREGGYLTVMNAETGEIEHHFEIGVISEEKADKYSAFSKEKAVRLFKNHKAHGHVTSYESRNVPENKYAGAVLVGNKILSFSGLPELSDEALMYGLAALCGLERLDVVVEMVYRKRPKEEGINILMALIGEIFMRQS